MKRIISIFGVLGLLAVFPLSAQQPVAAKVDSSTTSLDSKAEVYVKENIPFKKPIPYAPVREADVMFEKTVWREIDLRQKQNYPLYFPILPTRKIGSRVNLFALLMEGIKNGEITPYDPMPVSDEFAKPITYEQVINNPSLKEDEKKETSVSVFTGNDTTIIIKGKNLLEEEEIQRILIKEKIYFDKRHSTLNRVVVGMCPVFMYLRPGTEVPARIQVCWIYMPEARNLLARHPVFNRLNEAQNISYDDFFMQNRYHGTIVRVANVYNNRYINEYAAGIDALYEAQRIENEIFDFEQDLWEY